MSGVRLCFSFMLIRCVPVAVPRFVIVNRHPADAMAHGNVRIRHFDGLGV